MMQSVVGPRAGHARLAPSSLPLSGRAVAVVADAWGPSSSQASRIIIKPRFDNCVAPRHPPSLPGLGPTAASGSDGHPVPQPAHKSLPGQRRRPAIPFLPPQHSYNTRAARTHLILHSRPRRPRRTHHQRHTQRTHLVWDASAYSKAKHPASVCEGRGRGRSAARPR